MDRDNDPQGMGVLLGRFLEWLAVKSYSERTVAIRRACVGYFIEWAGQRGLARPSEVTRPILERYQRFMTVYRKVDGEPLSVRTQVGRLCSLRSWFKWLARNNHILYNPASEMEMPREGRRLPRGVLTAKEAEQVVARPDVNTPLGLRDRAILETFYSTGMRRTELVNLTLHDIDRERGTVMIQEGKGRKDRVIPIGERALEWVARYLEESRPRLAIGERAGGVLFLTNLGEVFHPVHMTKLVRDHVLASGVPKKGSCHLFRHTCATLMLEGGADVRFIQALLGHAKLDTTMIYTQVSIRMLKEIHTATHPAKPDRKPQEGRLALHEGGGPG